jgi:transcriptional regulator with XRE-family HTH domain
MESGYTIEVGERIKALREDKRISLRLLAKRSGISANALSLIERGKTSPTVTTLVAVARAFNVPIHEFFSDGDRGKGFVVYRKAASRQAGAIEPIAADLKGQNLNPLFLRLGPDDRFRKDLVFHPGDEFVYCLSGEVECEIDADKVRLSPGDAVTFKAEMPHRILGISPSGSDVLVVFEVGRLG